MFEKSTELWESVLSQFMEDGVVCSAILRKGLFATSAVEFNHNHSATTAIVSFHGTDRSVFQHLVSSPPSNSKPFEYKGQIPTSKAISCLQETYTNIEQAFLKSKPIPPILPTPISLETSVLSMSGFSL